MNLVCKIDNCCNNSKYDSQRSFIYHIKKQGYENLESYLLDHDLIKIKYCMYCDNKSSFNQKIENIGKFVQTNHV